MEKVPYLHRIRSRKFLFAVMVFVVSTAMLWHGVLGVNGPDVWERVVTWVTGLYMAGNVGQSIADKISLRLSAAKSEG